MHPIAVLQAALVEALNGDSGLLALGASIYDAPVRGQPAPYVIIDRHDIRKIDGDLASGQEHRVLLHCWSDQPSRKAALELVARVEIAGLALAPTGLTVTHAEHVRTETVVDSKTGQARAAVLLRFFSE